MTGKFNVDNISYNFIQGNTILQGCLDIGVEIPRFCYHQKLSIAGNCRMCLVEVAFPKTLKPVASCALPISNNMSIFTNTMLVKKAREGVLEFLLANHPLDCPICDQGGECDLQDQSIFFGSDRGRFYEDKRVVEDKECSPLIKTVMTRCIHCTRCVRFATEIAGINSLGVLGRGASMEIGTYIEQLVDSELSGNIIDLCPVGALTSKPYAFTSRPWELKSFETIDILDSICSRIRVDIRGLEVMRILPSINEDINEDWITDKIRFCYDGLHKHRLCTPVIKIKNFFILLSWENILYFFCQFFGILSNFSNFINSVDNNLKNNITVNSYSQVNKKFSKNISGKFFYFLRFLSLKNKIYFYFGNLIDCETLSAIRNFSFSFGSNNFFLLSNQKFGNNSNDLRNFYLLNCMFSDIEKNDFIFLFNLNPRLELPLLNLKIRKAVLNFGAEVYSLGFLSNTSYSIIQEGVSFKNFFKFLNGKFLSSINVLNMKNSLFLFGSRFLKNFSNFFLFNSLLSNSKFFYLNLTSINIIHNSSGIINSCEFNVNFFKKSNLFSVKNSLLYLLNIDFMDLSKTVVKDFIKNFTIFQGFLGNYISFCSDFILPSVNFVEKDSFFCNLEGRLQKTKIILNSLTSMRRTDWRILNIIKLVTFQMWGNFGFFRKNFFFYNFSSSKKSIKFFFNKFNTFFKLVDFRKYYMSKINPSFELTGINSININYFKNYNIFLSAKDIFFLTNYFVVSNNFNFFLNNIISYSSKILSISADKFKTRQNNFVFL